MSGIEAEWGRHYEADGREIDSIVILRPDGMTDPDWETTGAIIDVAVRESARETRDAGKVKTLTFYDDAEFAAIRATREAVAEDDGPPRSVAVDAVVADMFERHGQDGVTALVLALSRHLSAALSVVAEVRGMSKSEVLDDFEQHKLAQIAEEQDEEEFE